MSTKARLGIVMAAIAVLVLAVPISAHAASKYPTRLRGYYGYQNEYVVDRTVPGSAIATPVAQLKLQRYYRGKWQDMKGYVKVYRTTDTASNVTLWGYSKTYARGAFIKATLGMRGEYKFVYKGDAYHKATSRTTYRYDDIVSFISTATPVPEKGSTDTTFSVSQTVTWNTVDFPNLQAILNNYITFYSFDLDTGDGLSSYYSWTRTVNTPGTYTHSWNAPNADYEALPYHTYNSYLQFVGQEYLWPGEVDDSLEPSFEDI